MLDSYQQLGIRQDQDRHYEMLKALIQYKLKGQDDHASLVILSIHESVANIGECVKKLRHIVDRQIDIFYKQNDPNEVSTKDQVASGNSGNQSLWVGQLMKEMHEKTTLQIEEIEQTVRRINKDTSFKSSEIIEKLNTKITEVEKKSEESIAEFLIKQQTDTRPEVLEEKGENKGGREIDWTEYNRDGLGEIDKCYVCKGCCCAHESSKYRYSDFEREDYWGRYYRCIHCEEENYWGRCHERIR